MKEDPQGIPASGVRDVAVTEVHSKQVRVRAALVLVVGVEPTLNRF
jgi:hypothetical protein